MNGASLNIKTISSSDDGKTFDLPQCRVGSAADARSVIALLVQAEIERSKRRAKINGMANGNKPWPGLLRQIGQADRANFNQREFEGFVAAAKTPYYDLTFQMDRFAQFELEYGRDPARQKEWSDKVATRYHYALDDWDGIDMNFQRSQYQMVVHGAGPMLWEDTVNWHSKSCMAGQILLPDDSSADIEEWETAAVPRSYLPAELWEKIKSESAATAAGWNVPETKLAIMRAAPEEMQKRFGTTWEFYESEIRKGVIGFNSKSKRIFVTGLFQKEFSNKISHFILVDPTGSTVADGESTEQDDLIRGFLFRKVGRFESFSELVCPFLYDVGPDGQWHSVKGAGPKIFDFCSVSDRLTMRMIDGANVASGLVLRASNAKALQETSISHIAGGVVVHPDYEVQQNRFADNLQSPLLVKRELRNTMDGNTGAYRRRSPNETPYPTLGQEQIDVSQQAMLTQGDVNRYYRSLNKWHRETFRRMLALGKKLYGKRKNLPPLESGDEARNLTPSERGAYKFYSGCLEDGVPPEALVFDNFCRIKATRSIGHGSTQMRQIIADKFMAMLPTMDERGRNFTLRLAASTLGGQTMADAIYPKYDTPILADDQMWQAAMENNILRQPNAQIPVTPNQDAIVHVQSHFQDVSQHAKEIQAGQGTEIDLLTHLENLGPHTLQHIQTIQNDPTRKAAVSQLIKAWQSLSKMTDQLNQQVQEAAKAAQANQPAPGPDPATISALAKVHLEADIKREKMMGDMALKRDKQSIQTHLSDVKTAHGMRLQKAKTASEVQLADAETAHEMALQRAKKQSDIELADMETAHRMRLDRIKTVSEVLNQK